MQQLDLILENSFNESVAIKKLIQAKLFPTIIAAGEVLAMSLAKGNKIMCCGNGGSAADSQHFAGELVNRFLLKDRPPLSCIALNTDSSVVTAIANDFGYDEIFAKQVLALGNGGDVLLAISTSGNSPNVLRAIKVAQDKGMFVVALTAKDGGKMFDLMREGSDIAIKVPKDASTPRIQEAHILILHCLCELIEYLLFQSKL